MLRAEGLEVAYGKIQALWRVTFEVPQGEIVALVGANGAGKTTTLKALSGLRRPRAGAVTLDAQRLDRCSPAEIVERGVVHVPEGRQLFPGMTVLDNLLMGGYVRGARARRRGRLEEVFAIFPRLRERQRQLAGTLSGGEQQMVAIGRGLMAGPRVLMLDEPSLGLFPHHGGADVPGDRRHQPGGRHGAAGGAEHRARSGPGPPRLRPGIRPQLS